MIVCNHVSFVDALVIAAAPPLIRFVMDHRIFRLPIIAFVFRTGVRSRSRLRKEDRK